jgi:uncharacterized membrane protein YbhN (UPF0104 family)
MRRLRWRWSSWLVGVVVLGLVLWWTGSDPFVAGVRSLDVPVVALGAALAVPTTVACAWRWRLVAQGLGVGLDPGAAVASCYRAQFLNTVLPGGLLGDVHRGMHHGRTVGDTGRGLRAVGWERTAGQVVQAVIAVGVLVLLPSPVRSTASSVLGALAAGAVAAGIVVMLLGLRGFPAPAACVGRVLGALREDLRQGLLARATWPGIVVASTVAVAGHLATYVVAARAAGVTASTATLLPLALLVLVTAGLPTNIAGWGPREGVAAWSFAAAGLGADQGVATAVAYAVIVTVANLPGAVVVVGTTRRGGVRPQAAASLGRGLAEERRAHG